jgi:hypothetical protein
MTAMRREALAHMGKAMDLLDLDVISPASCYLQMAIDLIKEDVDFDLTAPAQERIDLPARPYLLNDEPSYIS